MKYRPTYEGSKTIGKKTKNNNKTNKESLKTHSKTIEKTHKKHISATMGGHCLGQPLSYYRENLAMIVVLLFFYQANQYFRDNQKEAGPDSDPP